MTENKRILPKPNSYQISLYFETEPLRENFTYAFRARAGNGAGYGGYSEILVVEVK